MSRLLRRLRSLSPSRTPARPGPATARPTFEALEDRRVPTGVGLLPGYSLLNHAQVSAVYYGPGWDTAAQKARISQLDAFLANITDSSYMDMLGEYGVGRGSFSGHVTTSDKWSTTWTLLPDLNTHQVLDD